MPGKMDEDLVGGVEVDVPAGDVEDLGERGREPVRVGVGGEAQECSGAGLAGGRVGGGDPLDGVDGEGKVGQFGSEAPHPRHIRE